VENTDTEAETAGTPSRKQGLGGIRVLDSSGKW